MENAKVSQFTMKVVENLLNEGKHVELALINGKIVVWAVSSKKKYEQPTEVCR